MLSAKAIFWCIPDTEVRKRGERTGLDTLVVHAINDADYFLEDKKIGVKVPQGAPHLNTHMNIYTSLLRAQRKHRVG